MLRCDRVAPLGKPVVPDVYWMLMGSSGCRVRIRSFTTSASTFSPAATTSAQSLVPMKTTRSRPGHSGAVSSTIAR